MEVDGETVWRRCECAERRRLQRLFASSAITEEFRALSFENFAVADRPQAVRSALSACRHYVQSFEHIRTLRQNGIGLHGKPGSGKTHLLMATCNALLDAGVSVLYFPWVTGSNELREAVAGDSGESVQKRLTAMKTADLLYVDDLFKGRKEPTAFMLESLFDVVNDRYLNHRPILVSSERTPEQIMEIDEGIGSRLYEMAKGHQIVMALSPGEKMTLNYRLTKGGE